MITLKKNQVLTLAVKCIKKESNRSYYVCDLGDGDTYDIGMFSFQKKEEVPAEIEVFVREVKESGPVLSQNTACLFRRFYEEGKTYTFQVEHFIPAYPKPYYRITDRNGLTVKLTRFGDREGLAPLQYISCRVNAISQSTIDLELVDVKEEKHILTFRPLSSNGSEPGWLELVNTVLSKEEQLTREQRCFARWALLRADSSYLQLSNVLESYRSKNDSWIIDLVITLHQNIKDWMGMLLKLNKEDARYSNTGFYIDLLRSYRKLCIYLLEDSDEISNIVDEQIRTGYQEALAAAERDASHFESAVDLLVGVKEDAAKNYTERVLQKIEKSGFLLQPEQRLHTLQTLFFLEPDLMDEVFPQFMWSIIGSRNIWMKEPFHSLLFGLLECYIEHSTQIIDTVGYDEDDIEHNRLNLTLRAIVLELLIASPSDNVDRLHYRALLYRLASYVPNANCEILLEKSLRCLTEQRYSPLEFGWTVAQMLNPNVLVSQLGTPLAEPHHCYKVFQGTQAELIIEDGCITISTYESELRQRKQLAAEMLPWHTMQILAGGKPDSGLKPTARETELSKYSAWWVYLERCVFGSKAQIQSTKTKNGDNGADLLEPEAILDRRSLIEIARIIDRYAVLQDNLQDTYNYISFAALLVKLAEDPWLQANYEARRRLLLGLFRFSKKETVSVENTLNEFGDIDLLVNTDRYTRKLVQEVRVVTCIGNTAQNQTLWSVMQDSVDEEVQQLCQLVLAYNMLDGIELQSGQKEEIIEKINSKLGITITLPQSICLGSESSMLEFKTSIVYPPSKTGRRRIALAEQTHEILRNICGFLNAEGGTLMLGVNDFGRISGLESDLAYKEFEGSRDRYCRYLRDTIREEMGDMAESLVTETILDMAGHFVLALRIRPSEQPVYLRDNLWQRSGNETLNRVGEVRSTFLHTRPMLYAQLPEQKKFCTDWKLNVSLEQPQQQEQIVEAAPKQEKVVKPKAESGDTLTRALDRISKDYKREYEISTSQIRQKKISNGDVYPSFYLYLTEGEYYRTESEYGDDDKVMLSLPVLTDDLEEDSWLILVYSDATVLRVPIEEIRGRNEWRTYKRFSDAKLFFAGIGSKYDSLVSVFRGNTSPQYRCDDIEHIAEGGMQDNGQPLVTCKFQELCYCEIVSRLAISGMRPGIYNPVKNTLGITVQAVGGDPERRTLARAGIKTDF